MNHLFRLTSMLACVGFLGGCATLVRGNKQTIHLVTDPPAAKVIVDGKPYVTPADVIFKRDKKPHDVVVQKDGYQGVEFKLSSHWDAGGVGAVAIDAAVPGGSALFVIDFLAGADRDFNKIATITLPPTTQSSPPLVTLYEHKGKLYNKTDYDAAVEHDKLFKSKKKGAATQPAK